MQLELPRVRRRQEETAGGTVGGHLTDIGARVPGVDHELITVRKSDP